MNLKNIKNYKFDWPKLYTNNHEMVLYKIFVLVSIRDLLWLPPQGKT